MTVSPVRGRMDRIIHYPVAPRTGISAPFIQAATKRRKAPPNVAGVILKKAFGEIVCNFEKMRYFWAIIPDSFAIFLRYL